MDLISAQDIANAAGVGVGALSSARNYGLGLNFAATHTAVTQTKSATVKTIAGAAFVVDAIIGAAWATAAGAWGLARTPFAAESWFNDGTNVVQPSASLLVDIRYNTRGFSNTATRWPNVIGTIQRPYIPLFPFIIAPASDVVIQVQDLQATVTPEWEIVLWGHYVGL